MAADTTCIYLQTIIRWFDTHMVQTLGIKTWRKTTREIAFCESNARGLCFIAYEWFSCLLMENGNAAPAISDVTKSIALRPSISNLAVIVPAQFQTSIDHSLNNDAGTIQWNNRHSIDLKQCCFTRTNCLTPPDTRTGDCLAPGRWEGVKQTHLRDTLRQKSQIYCRNIYHLS